MHIEEAINSKIGDFTDKPPQYPVRVLIKLLRDHARGNFQQHRTAPMIGKILGGRYQIIKHLGGGGFGQTYLAEDKQLPGNPQCVVKQLKPQATNSENLEVAERLFNTEAQVLYKLGNHPQIPQLLAHFQENQ